MLFKDDPPPGQLEDVQDDFGRTTYFENFLYSDLPDSEALRRLISECNSRDLTFQTDALYAFMGTLTAFQCSHKGGFMCGLPLLYFDIALIWQSVSYVRRRGPDSKIPRAVGIPRWSWSGWQCEIAETKKWSGFMAYNKGDHRDYYTDSVILTVRWFYHVDIDGQRKEIKAEWYDYKTRYYKTNIPPPFGWEKNPLHSWKSCPDDFLHEDEPNCYYTHKNFPADEFWYPIPLPNMSDTHAPSIAPYLSCRTRRTLLRASRFDSDTDLELLPSSFRDPKFNRLLFSPNGDRIGHIHVMITKPDDGDNVMDENDFTEPLEIVELSKGHSLDIYLEEALDSLQEVRLITHHYHVMWIERQEGVAYRKGIGEVQWHEWEELEKDDIELTLG